jgi:hypothetical protein
MGPEGVISVFHPALGSGMIRLLICPREEKGFFLPRFMPKQAAHEKHPLISLYISIN